MLPIKHKSIFKSRWIALLWAGGILWTAVDFAGGRTPAADGNSGTSLMSNEDMAAAQVVANELDGVK